MVGTPHTHVMYNTLSLNEIVILYLSSLQSPLRPMFPTICCGIRKNPALHSTVRLGASRNGGTRVLADFASSAGS